MALGETFSDEREIEHCRMAMHRIAEAEFPADALDAWFSRWRDKLENLLHSGVLDSADREIDRALEEAGEARETAHCMRVAVTEAVLTLKKDNLRKGDVATAIEKLEEALEEE